MAAATQIAWSPHAGAQMQFMSCPAREVLVHGTRGGGKTDCLIMDFAQFVGRGLGADWRGILFREEHTQLADVVAKTLKWFTIIWGDRAQFNRAEYVWKWDTGEALYLRHGKRPEDYNKYHGHQYPWIGFEELTNWGRPDFYLAMHSCCRCANADAPRRIRATSNPWGPGHSWVKDRFVDLVKPGEIYKDRLGLTRAHVFSDLRENPSIMESDPEYLPSLEAIEDEAKRKAWLEGSWDIVAGGLFSDVWDASRHVVEPFDIPKGWRVDRCFDWGSSAPFAVLWVAESDGTGDIGMHHVRGDLFVIAEWYGWNGKPGEGCRMLAADIAQGIKEREGRMPYRVRPGPADSAIFTNENGMCIADDMASVGVRWNAANKSKGSRVNGWEIMRHKLASAKQSPHEEPSMRIFDTCRHLIRTLPVLPRDNRNPDDADTTADDHLADALRYRCLEAPPNRPRPANLLR